MTRKRHKKRKIDIRVILVIILAVMLALGICVGVLTTMFGIFYKEEPQQTDTKELVEVIEKDREKEIAITEEEIQDPQNEENIVSEEIGAETKITKILITETVAETEKLTLGIDVSKFQGTIDWTAVADAGIDFAIVRVGYRTQSTGEIVADTNAKYNMQEATANGLKIGAYFFPQRSQRRKRLKRQDGWLTISPSIRSLIPLHTTAKALKIQIIVSMNSQKPREQIMPLHF